MVDWIEPLLPVVNSDPDMRVDELAAAARASTLRQKVLEEVLRGERPEDDFNDLLRAERWDVDDYWAAALENVEAFIRQGIIPEALEFSSSGLVIPRHDNA
jgi:folate-binding Fe-S cluster repair protein YgfZ